MTTAEFKTRLNEILFNRSRVGQYQYDEFRRVDYEVAKLLDEYLTSFVSAPVYAYIAVTTTYTVLTTDYIVDYEVAKLLDEYLTSFVSAPVYAYIAVTTTYTVLTTDYIVDCTTGTFTVTLPTAVGITGQPFIIKNSGTGIITVDGNGSETIDGELDLKLYNPDAITIVSTGSNWIIV